MSEELDPLASESDSDIERVGWLQHHDGTWQAVDEDGCVRDVDPDDTLPRRLVELSCNRLRVVQ